MHGDVSQEEFLLGISGFLAAYYGTLALMNALAAVSLWKSGRTRVCFRIPRWGAAFSTAHVWLLAALFFAALAAIAFSGDPRRVELLSIPQAVRDAVEILEQMGVLE